jgi:hypothetical protein
MDNSIGRVFLIYVNRRIGRWTMVAAVPKGG